MEEKCRACLRTTTVFDWNIIAFDNITFSDMFWECTKLNKSDNNNKMPRHLCFMCGPALKTSYDFLMKACESDTILRAQLEEEDSKDFEVDLFEDEGKPSNSNEVAVEIAESEDDTTAVQYEQQFSDIEQLSDMDEKPETVLETNVVAEDDDSRTEPFPFEVVFDEIRNLNESKVSGTKYDCKFCNKSSRSLMLLERHILESHTQDPPIACRICDTKFTRKADMLQHFLSHKQNQDYVSFYDKDVHQFSCKICKQVFHDELMIRIHVARMHKRSEKYINEKWPLIFSNKKSLQEFVEVSSNKSVTSKDNKTTLPDASFESTNEDEIFEFTGAQDTVKDAANRKRKKVAAARSKAGVEEEDLRGFEDEKLYESDFERMSRSSECSEDSHHGGKFQKQLLDVQSIEDFRLLSSHIKEIRVEGGYLCQLCDAKSASMKGLKTHILQKHTKLSEVDCKSCGKIFTSAASLQKHHRKYQGDCDKLLACNHCDKTFQSKSNFDTHMYWKHRDFLSQKEIDALHSSVISGTSKGKSKERGSKSRTDESLNEEPLMVDEVTKEDTTDFNDDQAFQSAMEDDETIFQDLIEVMECSDGDNDSKLQSKETGGNSEMVIISDEISWDSDDWKKYVKDSDPNICKLEGAAPILICKLCSKCFTREAVFKTHLKGHFALTSKPTHACDRCPKMFRSKHQLGVHIARTHENISEPKYLCDECPQKFMRKYGLERHKLNIHNKKDRMYGCKICGKKFPTPSIVLNHMATHDANREKKFKCNLCNTSFYTVGHKNRHMTLHNGTGAKCNVCNKYFTHESALKVHLVSHTGRKDFGCHHCDKTFQFRHQLAAHIKRINGVKLKCDMCEHKVNSHSEMRMHRIKTHFGKPYRCAVCGKDFAKGDRAYGHVQSVHKVANRDEAKAYISKHHIEPYRAEKKTYQEEIEYIAETQKLPDTENL